MNTTTNTATARCTVDTDAAALCTLPRAEAEPEAEPSRSLSVVLALADGRRYVRRVPLSPALTVPVDGRRLSLQAVQAETWLALALCRQAGGDAAGADVAVYSALGGHSALVAHGRVERAPRLAEDFVVVRWGRDGETPRQRRARLAGAGGADVLRDVTIWLPVPSHGAPVALVVGESR